MMAALEPEQIRLHGEAVAGHWRGGVALAHLSRHDAYAASGNGARSEHLANTHWAEYGGKTELPVRCSISIYTAVGTVDLCRRMHQHL